MELAPQTRAEKLTPKMNRFAKKIIAHANAVRGGSNSLTKTDATYLLGVIDCDIGILQSKKIFNEKESLQLRTHVMGTIFANPSLLSQVRLRAHDKRAYRDF